MIVIIKRKLFSCTHTRPRGFIFKRTKKDANDVDRESRDRENDRRGGVMFKHNAPAEDRSEFFICIFLLSS